MITYNHGDPLRIQHSLKVYEFSNLIAEGEGLDDSKKETLLIASILHDVGIRYCEQKFGHQDGKMQEEYGVIVAKELLKDITGIDKDRIYYLISHHHTYIDVDDIDLQILLEADMLVNLFEDKASIETITKGYNKVFKTKTGKELMKEVYGI